MLIYQPELWSNRERLVYKPKALFLKAKLVIDFQKRDHQTATLAAVGEVNIPFKGEKSRSFDNEVSSEMNIDRPDIMLLPILLRSHLRESGEMTFPLKFGGRTGTLTFTPQRAQDSLVEYAVSVKSDGHTEYTGRAVWNSELGVLTEVQAPVPIVGNVTLVLSEHTRD